jgi:hypothetical protein
MLSLAKTLAKQPLEPVSTDGSWYLFTRDSEPQARTLARLSSYQDRYAGVSTPEIILEYLLKFAGSR